MISLYSLVTYQGSQWDYHQEVLKVMHLQGSRARCLLADGRTTAWIPLGDLVPLPPGDYYPSLSEEVDEEWDPPLEVLVAYSSH